MSLSAHEHGTSLHLFESFIFLSSILLALYLEFIIFYATVNVFYNAF